MKIDALGWKIKKIPRIQLMHNINSKNDMSWVLRGYSFQKRNQVRLLKGQTVLVYKNVTLYI